MVHDEINLLYTFIILLYKTHGNIFGSSSLSELTIIIVDIELTHLGSEASNNFKTNRDKDFFVFFSIQKPVKMQFKVYEKFCIMSKYYISYIFN